MKVSPASILAVGALATCVALAVNAAKVSARTTTEKQENVSVPWPQRPLPPNTLPLPVLASSPVPEVASEVAVCMYKGAQPERYKLIGQTCWRGSTHCTVFVAVPTSSYISIQEYDALNPPAVTTSEEPCSAPDRPVAGVFRGMPPRANATE